MRYAVWAAAICFLWVNAAQAADLGKNGQAGKSPARQGGGDGWGLQAVRRAESKDFSGMLSIIRKAKASSQNAALTPDHRKKIHQVTEPKS